jgi:hypothetical protein
VNFSVLFVSDFVGIGDVDYAWAMCMGLSPIRHARD